MRILLINDNHAPIGGAEQYFFDLKSRLKKVPGIEVFSLGFGQKPYHAQDEIILKGNHSKLTKWIGQIIFYPPIYFKIRRYLKKIRPDIIHIHNIKQYSTSLLAAIQSYPVVQTIHDYGAICPTAYNIHKNNLQACPTGFKWQCFFQHQLKYNFVVYLFLIYAFLKIRKKQKKLIKKFIAPSPLLVNYLKQNHFTHAVYIPPFVKARRHYSFDKIKPHHFLFAGQLGTHKGIHFLLEEFALARQKNNLLTLTLAGTGSMESVLHRRIKQLDLEASVYLVGWQNNLELYYQECVAVIFPSIWMEAFGLVMADAMTHARAIIGSNRGSPPWLIDDNQTGFIIDPCQPGMLAEKILMLADHLEYAKKLGKNGYEKIQSLIDNEATLKQIISCYLDASTSHDLSIMRPTRSG